MEDHIEKIVTIVIIALAALSYFFIDWSQISIFNLFK